MISIDNKYYYIDINEIVNFLVNNDAKIESQPDEERVLNAKDALIQKTVYVRNENDKFINLKFDIIKTMMDVIYSSGVETEDGNMKYTQYVENISIGAKIALNTMLVNNFIKNKLD